MGPFVPIPPSSAYCVQRSDSISSAAARNRRMATSPALREPLACVLACALAKVPLVSKPALTTAAPPARRLPFKKERRSTELPIGARSCFSFIFILMFLRLQSCSNYVPWTRLLPSVYGTPLLACYSFIPHNILQTNLACVPCPKVRRCSLSAARVCDRFRGEEGRDL